jgi:HSP20 family protein
VQQARAISALGVLDPLSEAVALLEGGPRRSRGVFPRWQAEVRLEETDERLVIRVGLPGARPENVRVRLAGDLLTLEADRRLDSQRPPERGFVRSFLLPLPVAAEAVDAELSDGTLTVTVDKQRRVPRRRVHVS